jgi:RNA polymerase sigma factor (sigma-70 family)
LEQTQQDNLTAGFNYLIADDHQVVVYGVLKRLHVYPWQTNYADLKQEGFLVFAQKYNQYPGIDADKPRLAYLYQAVYWHLLDILRKQTRIQQHQCIPPVDKTGLPNWETLEDSYDAIGEWMGQTLYVKLWQKCNHRERRFLVGSYEQGLTITEMARQWHVSRKTIYQWKKRVQNKYKKIGNTLDG